MAQTYLVRHVFIDAAIGVRSTMFTDSQLKTHWWHRSATLPRATPRAGDLTHRYDSKRRFGALSIALHWSMLLLLVAVYACIELREIFPKGSDPREALKAWHFVLGLCVLALVIVRIALRIARSGPPIDSAPASWAVVSAALMHLALYLFMIAMPILGWLMLSASGKPIVLFGLHLPSLIGASKGIGDFAKELHAVGGTAGYFLIGLHAAAALFHHDVIRDDSMRQMLPRAR